MNLPIADSEYEALDAIQRRVLWLSTLMIHHANHVRPNPDGVKVGGHQASSASSVTILTALYLKFLRQGDRVCPKPHASPAFWSLMYLMGALPESELRRLREFGGLQSYPSRTKDPPLVDFSTGSMGLGCAAPVFAALTQKYAHAHFGATTASRFVTMSGDAELDEGNVWEMLLDESMAMDNALWIVDLNRQSLDRVVPHIRAARLKRIFQACGWRVFEAKYGARLQAAFARPGGEALREAIDAMDNEEYQSLIRSDGAAVRAALAELPRGAEISACLAGVTDAELPGLLANLGGHDLPELMRVLEKSEVSPPQPTVILAYTIKGWGLPVAADPLNHGALLSPERFAAFRDSLGISEDAQWSGFPPGSKEYALLAAAAARVGIGTPPTPAPITITGADIPPELNATSAAVASTQEAFGRALLRLADLPRVGERVVTVSGDVASSTNLGGWINRVGAFSLDPGRDYEVGRNTTLRWQPGPGGQHIEFGIAETNVFLALSMLGLSREHNGQLLFPIGTVYDPFVIRALDAILYGAYSGARFIFAGTPSGVTLSPEGGAHQATMTSSLGQEMPLLDFWEPCFAIELEWALLEGLRQCLDRKAGRSTFLRLSTRPIEQRLIEPALARLGRDGLRAAVLNGGYSIRPARGEGPLVHIVTTGVLVADALAAAEALAVEGVDTNVIHLVSPRRAYTTWREGSRTERHLFDSLIPEGQRSAPIITVCDAASHSLAWIGSVFGQRAHPLGVDVYGQSGNRESVYRYVGIHRDNIIAEALAAVDLT